MQYHKSMDIKKYPIEHKLLQDLVADLKDDLGQNLIGLYLYGSLATDDFVDGLSDIDLLIVLKNDVDEKQLRSLTTLHDEFNDKHTSWSKRIDVAYLSENAFKSIKSEPYRTIVSDGSGGLEIVDAPEYYLIDWYKVQEHSIALCGPDVKTFLPHITVSEFKKVVRNYMLSWIDKTDKANQRGLQAYIVLTMCRSLYAFTYGKNTSKQAGADWSITQYPQWAGLIKQSLIRSRDEVANVTEDKKAQKEMVSFVGFILSELEKKA
jgi:predicted nucleotidyltransferase